MLKTADCALLIGDPALMIPDSRFRISDSKFEAKNQKPKTKDQFRKFDLVELWKSFTDCGFVFAMWMANEEKIERAKLIDFVGAKNEGLQHLDEIISNYESEITLPREDFTKYLSENISYSIDDSMQKGLELYFKLAHKNGLCESNKELKFV